MTPEKEEEIAKNLKKYSKKYEAEDQDVSLLLSEQEREKRRMLKEEWDKWVNEWKQIHEEESLQRQKLRDGEASDEEEEYEAKDIEVEEVIDLTEEVLHLEYGHWSRVSFIAGLHFIHLSRFSWAAYFDFIFHLFLFYVEGIPFTVKFNVKDIFAVSLGESVHSYTSLPSN